MENLIDYADKKEFLRQKKKQIFGSTKNSYIQAILVLSLSFASLFSLSDWGSQF